MYQIRSPLGKLKEVHASRLWFYAEEEEMQLDDDVIQLFEDSVKFFDVKQILGHDVNVGRFQFKIWWKGFPKAESTWENYEDLIESIPELIAKYLNKAKLKKNEKQILKFITRKKSKKKISRFSLKKGSKLVEMMESIELALDQDNVLG